MGEMKNTLIMNISIKIPLRTNTLKKKVQLISRKCLKSLSYFFLKKLNNIKTQIFNIIKFYSGKRIYTEWNDASLILKQELILQNQK